MAHSFWDPVFGVLRGNPSVRCTLFETFRPDVSTPESSPPDAIMAEQPQVVLSAFADEAANQKTAVQQFAALAAVGLQYYSLRFIDVGSGIKNVLQLSRAEIQQVRHLEDEYGLNVASIGSPIGKVKLKDVDDGTKNAFIPFKKYLDKEVKRACELAHAFETKLIRGFSFYHPKGTDPADHVPQVVDQLGQIAETCLRSDLTFGVEIEANLVGQTGQLLAEIHRQVDNAALVLVFDGANILCQGYSGAEVFEQYQAMKNAIGWMHVKDYRYPAGRPRQRGHVDEDALKHFVPADLGESGYEGILKDFRVLLPKLSQKLRKRGIPGVFLDLEPHLKGGGQFGGFSGPDGLGVALRGLCKVLDYVSVDYHLCDFDDIKAARGNT
jgi:sugar phosphate isomerase/epimerase